MLATTTTHRQTGANLLELTDEEKQRFVEEYEQGKEDFKASVFNGDVHLDGENVKRILDRTPEKDLEKAVRKYSAKATRLYNEKLKANKGRTIINKIRSEP